MADMNELMRGRLAEKRLELASERARREGRGRPPASDHPAGGSADGGARGIPPDVTPTMNELIRGHGERWTDGP